MFFFFDFQSRSSSTSSSNARVFAPNTHVITSTPSRKSAHDLSSSDLNNDTAVTNVATTPGSRFNFNDTKSPSRFALHELSAEIDLSDPQTRKQSSSFDDYSLGTAPLEDSHEHTPMFMPRANTRVVRIISKQSNV